MSQNSIVLPVSGTHTGLEIVQDINAALDTLQSQNGGPSAPSTTQAGMPWLDTSVTPNVLRIRNSANSAWVTIGPIDYQGFGVTAGLRNKLIGGHFDSNPWLRGTSFTVTSSGTYVADRWRIDFDGTANISVAKVALPTAQVINGVFCRYGMKITVNSKSGNTYMRLSQRIEGVDTLTTLAATLQTAVLGSGSFSVPVQVRQSFGTGGSPSADVVAPFTTALVVTGSMQQLNTGLTVPDMSGKALGTGGGDFLATEYDLTNIPVGGYIVVALSGLEYGSQATIWEDRRRIEPLLCKRYTRALRGESLGYTNSGASTYTSGTIFFLDAEMRAAPTLAAGASYTVSSGATGTPNLGSATTQSASFNNTGAAWTVGVVVTITGVLQSEL